MSFENTLKLRSCSGLRLSEDFISTRIGFLFGSSIIKSISAPSLVFKWEKWLRKLIDRKKYEIIVTDSSAKLLSSKLATSLTGRALEYKVWSLSFSEILEFKKLERYSHNEKLSILREMFEWGGLQEVVKSDIE